MLSIKEMVSDGKKVKFKHYRHSNLIYSTENGFEFPVPISDIGDATFQAEDKAIMFMRYIRKAIAEQQPVEPSIETPAGLGSRISCWVKEKIVNLLF